MIGMAIDARREYIVRNTISKSINSAVNSAVNKAANKVVNNTVNNSSGSSNRNTAVNMTSSKNGYNLSDFSFVNDKNRNVYSRKNANSKSNIKSKIKSNSKTNNTKFKMERSEAGKAKMKRLDTRKDIRRERKKEKMRAKMRAKRMKLLLKMILLVPLIVLVSLLFFGNSANGQTDVRESKNEYYHELEERYMEVLRSELGRHGMGSAGVTMTSVIDINGDRSYNVVLHHEKIEKMDEEQRDEFMAYIDGISFADCTIPVSYEILN